MVDELHPPRWDLGWLSLTRPASAVFPSLDRRLRRAATAMCAAVGKGPALQIHGALTVLCGPTDVPDLAPLIANIDAARRAHQGADVGPLMLGLRMLDAARRRLSSDPLAHALDAMGRTEVPATMVGVAIDLGLAIRMAPSRAWEASGAGTSRFIPWKPEYLRDSPEERRQLVCLRTIARAADRCLGTKVRRPWKHVPDDDGVRANGNHELAEPSVFVLRMLERLPRREPRCLELYELFADTVEPRHREAAERAAETFIEGIGEPGRRPELRLRAALRRVALGEDLRRAQELGAEAYHGLLRDRRRRGACMAASAVGRAAEREPGTDRIEWLERAWELAAELESPPVLARLLYELHEAYRREDDGSGQLHTMLRIEALVDEHGPVAPLRQLPEAVIGLPVPHPPADERPLPRRFVEQVVERGDIEAVARALTEYVADLLEHHDPDEVVRALDELLAAAQGRPVASLLAEALADLCEHDDARWSAYKETQLRLQDRAQLGDAAASQPPRSSAGARAILRHRVAECTAEAEAAYRAGAIERAKFWVRHAERYRVGLDGG